MERTPVERITESSDETRNVGAVIGQHLHAGAIVGMDGTLGAGKTCLVQGMAVGLGLHPGERVTSPAYTLVQEYATRHATLVHMDWYRLESLSASDALLFDEFLDRPRTVIVVEWASKFLHKLVPSFLGIRLTHGARPDQRCIRAHVRGDTHRYTAAMDALASDAHRAV